MAYTERDLWLTGQASLALLTPVQQAALDEIYRIWAYRRSAVLLIARRVGKSHLDVAIGDSLCRTKPKAQVKHTASTERNVKTFLLPIFDKILALCPAELRPRWQASESTFIYPNNSRYMLVGCEDRAKADRLRGPDCDLALVDEAAFIPVLSYVVDSVLKPQLMTCNGHMLLSSSAPESTTHEFVNYIYESAQHDALIKKTIHDATHISPEVIAEYCAEFGGALATVWRREFLCEIVTDESRSVVPEWASAEKDIVQSWPFKLEPCDRYTVGDLGFQDMSVIGYGFSDYVRDRKVLKRERALSRANLGDVARHILDDERALWGDKKPKLRVLDASPQVLATLAGEFGVSAVPPKRDTGASIIRLRDAIRDRQLVLDPSMKVTIAHMKGAIWNTAGTSYERYKGTQTTPGHHFDGLDMVRYFNDAVDTRRTATAAPVRPGPDQSSRAYSGAPFQGGGGIMAALRRRGRV